MFFRVLFPILDLSMSVAFSGGQSNGAHHVCTKCGWNYPNPHPSAKNRRSHKKICGTIKGFEIPDSEMPKQNLDLQEDPCLDDEQKLPSPRVVEKADERIGEEDVFAYAVSEFSRSDSFKEKEETATNCIAKNPGETQPGNKSPEVVQESCEVPPVEVLDNFPKSVEAASGNQQGGEPFIEGHSMPFVTLNDSSQGAQVIEGGGDTISNVGLETDCKEDLPDESESKLASALGKRKDIFDPSWNDEVIYSDLEGPHGFAFEEMSMIHPGEAEYTVVSDDNVPVNTSSVGTNADQVISTKQSSCDDIPFTENADVSLDGTKHEEVESNLPETPKGEECETDTRSKAENVGISIGTEVSSSDKLLLEDKAEPQGQTAVEIPSGDNLVIAKAGPEDIIMKAEEGESSSFGVSQETVESEIASLPEVVPIVADSNADMSRSDLTGHESKLIQANLVTEENSPKSKLISESSCDVQHYVSVAMEGDDQKKSSPETSIDSILEIGAETCDEARIEQLVEESSFIRVADPLSNFATDESAQTANNQKLVESGRTEFNRVVGGLGVIQANEIDSDVLKAHNLYAEVPVTIESNDLRDFGRLQNLSEAHIRSLVSSPLVTRNNNTYNAFASTSATPMFDGTGLSENGSQSSSLAVALSENQEITMEKTAKDQHVPLKNLLSEARSPRLAAAAAAAEAKSNIPRVSSILLDQETSPEEGGRWPERREVSEEWKSPAKYPVELKREERKVKGRPFWVPFVCCSSVK
ncbi:PREDICTED: uncharacterized protein LOC106336863 isoform X1 [Brassica oleracea var. oleracea]|uniref:uncharacterized protein LOC106336863 isoform X1 n=2 Tax=Brassica oleracea var. oleracea TaxID=109376 RepID=UPI0006A708A2|nr:PREDICTED: uncharacterized protein LOC106336863 isoform X1 [Brassica oleracea var. oleracea]